MIFCLATYHLAVQPLFRDLQIFGVEFYTHKAALHLERDKPGGSGPDEGIQDHIACAGTGGNTRLNEGGWKCRKMRAGIRFRFYIPHCAHVSVIGSANGIVIVKIMLALAEKEYILV